MVNRNFSSICQLLAQPSPDSKLCGLKRLSYASTINPIPQVWDHTLAYGYTPALAKSSFAKGSFAKSPDFAETSVLESSNSQSVSKETAVFKLSLLGLSFGLLLLSGCSDLFEQDELLFLEPIPNYKQQLSSLPECRNSADLRSCVVKSLDSAGDFMLLPYSEGELSGIAMSLFANGKLKAVYTYKNGKRDGVFYEYYDDGIEQISGHYLQNQLQGVLKNNYPTGVTQTLTVYEHDLKHGPFTTFNGDGSLFSYSLYKDSQLVNPMITYFPDGQVQTSFFEQGKLTKAEVILPNGEHERFEYINNQFNGFAQLFYANGQLKRSIKIADGMKEGYGTRYYSTGQLQGLYHYSQGLLQGHALRYLPNGSLHMILSFQQDRLASGMCGDQSPLTSAEMRQIQNAPFDDHANICTAHSVPISP